MPKTIPPLTATKVEKSKPAEREYNLADGYGLMLRVKPSGSKAWYFNYYHPHTRKRKAISLGPYPEISLQSARNQRHRLRELLSKGLDPQQKRDEEKRLKAEAAEATFKAVSEEWMEVHATKVKSGTLRNIKRYFEKDVYPSIGHMPIAEITAPVAIDILKKITDRQSYEIARKVARRMNCVMTHAVRTASNENIQIFFRRSHAL